MSLSSEGKDPGPCEAGRLLRLDLGYVLCLRTPQALDYVVAHPDAFVEVPEPTTPYRGVAEKEVLAPVVGRDVAVPLIPVEPLQRSFSGYGVGPAFLSPGLLPEPRRGGIPRLRYGADAACCHCVCSAHSLRFPASSPGR